MATAQAVEFWFDPICPFTWITSRWVDEVAQQRGLEVQWNPFSLKVLNVGLDEGDDAQAHVDGHRMGRVVEAARQRAGQEHLGALYRALGERLHPGGRSDIDAIIAEAVAEAGLPADLVAAADDASYDAELEASTGRAIARTGKGVGIPIIGLGERAYFGPVFTRRPKGAQALELWDAYVTMTAFDGFFELKREITGELQF